MRQKWRRSRGLVQIPLIVGMVVMALALPVAMKLSSQSQDPRNRAAEAQCSSGDKQCSGNTIQTCSGGKWVNGTYCSNGCANGACKNACAPNSSCGASTCKGQTCKDSCGNTWQGQKDCSTPTNTPAPTTPPRECTTATSRNCDWYGKPGTDWCNAEGKWGGCSAKNPCSGECVPWASDCATAGRTGAGGDCASGVCCGGSLPTATPVPPTATPTPMCRVGETRCNGSVEETCYSPAPGTLVWNSISCIAGCNSATGQCNPKPTNTPTPPAVAQRCDYVGSRCCFDGIEPWCDQGLVESTMNPDSCLCKSAATPTPTSTKPTLKPTPICQMGQSECAGSTFLRTCSSPEPGEYVWKLTACSAGCDLDKNECKATVTPKPTVSGRPAPAGSYRKPRGL